MTVVSSAQFLFLILGLVGVVFTHNVWFTVAATLTFSSVFVFPAWFTELTPTLLYVFAVRNTMLLFAGAGIGAFLVTAFRTPALIDPRVLVTTSRSRMTLLGIYNLVIFVAAGLLLASVLYAIGAYDEPTFGLFISNGQRIGPNVAIFGSIFSILTLFLILWAASATERSGVGATNTKYWLALTAVLLPQAVYDLGTTPFQLMSQLTAGLITLALLVTVYIALYFWAVGVSFARLAPNPARALEQDRLFRRSRLTQRFVVGLGLIHILTFLTMWGTDAITNYDPHTAFYAAAGIGGVWLLLAIIVGAINGAYKYIERDQLHPHAQRQRAWFL